MSYLIDSTYFTKGYRLIPNLDKPQILESLNNCIAEHQEKFLIEQFGYVFQKTMMENQSDAKYAAILNGAEFSAGVHVYRWQGIKEPLADYVYFQFIKENIIKLSGVGYTSGNVENSIIVQPVSIPVAVYNRFVNEMKLLLGFMFWSDYEYDDLIWKERRLINEFGI